MKNITKIFIGLLFISLLSGCFARYEWRKFDGTPSNLGKDSYECEIKAAKTYPPKIIKQKISDAYQKPPRIICPGNKHYHKHNKNFNHKTMHRNINNCIVLNGEFIPARFSHKDVNKSSRENLKNECLKSRGWQYIKVN